MSNAVSRPMSCLPAKLESISSEGPLCEAAVDAVIALAMAAANIATVIRFRDADAALGAVSGSANVDGDDQKALDIIADEMIQNALSEVKAVASYLSEEQDAAVQMHDDGTVIVASDPLDGSSNIDTNVSIGTIFSILPAAGGVLQAGSNQIAAGFFLYGPQTTLLITFGKNVMAFQLDDDGEFYDMDWQVKIIPDTDEFAINASNMRQWHSDVAAYITDCLAGATGPRCKISICAGLARLLLMRGGFSGGAAFSYIRLTRVLDMELDVCALFMKQTPLHFSLRQLAAKAVDGSGPILDLLPPTIHARVPFIFGSSNEVDEFMRYRS